MPCPEFQCAENVVKVWDLRLRCAGDQVPLAHIALSFVYKNDDAICLPHTMKHRLSRTNCLLLSHSTLSKD